ncbi:hypothetical protein E3983_01050 [Legionella israelensis]|uniref:Enhanced entry protein EnhB n=1 Tax=Legionella israelensis TaxID=454 RepID=A0A0W0VQM8_9GAMM|nr:hypothetical protein [Legionella israelensis]KTD22466.1 enhanced entry protein EnhB [Legionella israelensis]QBR83066.1 hypothetical protein E3983_01050 [Legionella israelensis]QBS09571.1 hypothetical protein E4T55_06690 [Legionella israelensis]QDP71596.1 hypothetical protein FOG18_02890 [Legionella israelensis]SCY16830.1 hypothetical protein SAMN02746069_01505 [Legionella israelensis DSM 19235]
MRYFSVILLSLFWGFVHAGSALPEFCQAIRIDDETALLKTSKTALFMIYNRTDNTLWLTHPVENPGASAGWTSELQPGHWSALNIGQDFTLNCVESSPGHEQQVSCKDAIRICRYKKVRFPKNNQGSYWAGENLPLKELLSHLAERGFVLPESQH